MPLVGKFVGFHAGLTPLQGPIWGLFPPTCIVDVLKRHDFFEGHNGTSMM